MRLPGSAGPSGARGAVRAEAHDREVAEARPESRRGLDCPAHAVQVLRRYGAVRSAALAHEVLALPPRQHIAPCPVPEMDVLNEAEALQRLEIAVHGSEIRGRRISSAFRDLLGTERRVGRVQRLEHHAARPRETQAASAQRRDRLRQRSGLEARPRMSGCHRLKVEDLIRSGGMKV
jgi:hypothetical protein